MIVNVIGASGFVGRNLVRFLEENGFRIREISLRDQGWVDNLLKEGDVYINLVGKAHDHDHSAEETEFYRVNFDLTKEIFRVFEQSSAMIYIHISSIAAVQEYFSKEPLKEDDLCNPESSYGKSKRSAEEWLMLRMASQDKKIFVVRPPMIHGQGDKGNLDLLFKLISRGIPYPLSSFKNSRSFISIDNFCFFIDKILTFQDEIPSGIYHIADDEPVSTNEIIEIIKDVTNKRVFNLYVPKTLVRAIARVGDFIPLPLNTTRLKKMTSDLIVSNRKIKNLVRVSYLPLTAKEGLVKTILSLKDK